jgi:serine/threonine protein kinase
MSMIGKTIAHYEITNQLGKGGMGEVYQAKDRKLGRDVAIKVLPDEFARDADRVARFQREAKLLASLNHPNIAAIYGLEEFGGTNFLVLELVEGETLADRIKAGPVPVEEALKLALQIAEALESAHEKGVIHRDLKPANIKVTPESKVKVLDFGLAKAFAGEQAELNLANSPTLTYSPTLSDAATRQGVILGTAAYMSPEQARGKPVDKRADIWSFGCVLYEMLTGRQTWTGTTVTDMIAAALAKDPDFGILPPNIHPRIHELLSRCLQKDPTERFRDVGDVRVEIKQLLADPKGLLVHPVTTVGPRTRLRTILPWIAATAILSIIVAGVAVWNLRKPETHQVMRFDYELPEGQQFSGGLTVSRDGKQFVYGTPKGLYLRSVDESTAKVIAGTEGDERQPFFSPDGKWIGYWSFGDKKLKKISVSGGAPVILCDDVQQLFGASWNENATIVYSQFSDGIMRISANGGTPESLVKAKFEALNAPQILPDGKSVLFTNRTAQPNKIMVQSLKSGVRKELIAGTFAHYLPTGHIVYLLPNNNSLFASPFDLDRLEVKGGQVPILENVGWAIVSDTGTLAYTSAPSVAATPGRTLVWVDRKGKEEPLSADPKQYRYPKISPDGKKIAISIDGKNSREIWVWDLFNKTLTRLTFDEVVDSMPVWTPDGKRIAYSSILRKKGGNGPGVFWKAADGAGQDAQLSPDADRAFLPFCWTSDGKYLVGAETPDLARFDIGMLSIEGNHSRKTLLQEAKVENQPQISPNGRWMAYNSDESGKTEIYVRTFPDVNKGRWQVSTSGGDSPLWSPDGRELFYLNGDAAMAVSLKTDPNFEIVGTPNALFRDTFVGSLPNNGTPWDISPDGKRFLMIKPPVWTGAAAAAPGPRKINIILNWFEELKQRVPLK